MDLKKLKKEELYEMAKKYNVKNRSKMTKSELVKAVSGYETKVSPAKAPQAQSSKTVTSHMSEPAPEEKPAPAKQPEYPIPDRYNTDTVVLLPINPKKEYVYWEISDKTLDKFCREIGVSNPVFLLKVFQGDEKSREELASVRASRYGNWYFDLYCPDMNLWAEIGLLDNMGNYHPIINSKKIKMPSDVVSKEIDEETWMTVGENIEKIFDLSGVSEMNKKELLSSARLHSELFKKLHQTGGLSSFDLSKGGEK